MFTMHRSQFPNSEERSAFRRYEGVPAPIQGGSVLSTSAMILLSVLVLIVTVGLIR